MADFEIYGQLSGTFLRRPYSFTADGRTVTLTERASAASPSTWGIAVRWPTAPDDSDEDVRALQAWLEDYLRAASVAVGSSAFVLWDGIHRYGDEGARTVGRWLTTRWSLARRDREQLDAYQSLVDGIRLYPEASNAAEYLQNALSLVHQSQQAAASEAYRAVEALVAGTPADGDWASFGSSLSGAGLPTSGDDLMQLWASFQLYRHSSHDPKATAKATRRLEDLGRPPLTYGECCWRAAELLEMYLEAKKL